MTEGSTESVAETASPELERAVLGWYRAMVTRILHELGSAANPRDREMVATIERAIVLHRLPSEEARRWLDHACRTVARRKSADSGGVQAGLFNLGRRMGRSFLGTSPIRHQTTSPASKTRVLHAIADLQLGGAQQLVVDLAASTPRHFPHHVIARSIGIRFRPGVACTEILGGRSRVHRIFDRHEPDVLHVCHYHASVPSTGWYDLVARIAMERGVPIVQTHSVIGDPWLGTDRQHLVFCSEWSRDRSGIMGVPDSVISPGTPLGFFRSPRRSIASNPVVGMVYRLDGDKIDESAAAAIQSVLRESPRARFEVVGDGPVRPSLERSLERAGLSDRIVWHGYVPSSRLPSVHRAFDVEIAPVVADTFGSGVVHAIASGTPVVGYGVAALPGILREDAAIARPGSPEDIGRKVGAILRDDALHAEVHAAQWSHASSNFGIDSMITSYHRLFSKVARHRTPSTSA